MDRESLIATVEKQHHFRVDPNDPVFMLATIAEIQLKEAREAFSQEMVTMLDQIAAANVQTEESARARAEAIISQAGDWCAARVRDATSDILVAFVARIEAVQAETDAAARRTRLIVPMAFACSIAALSAAVATAAAVFQF